MKEESEELVGVLALGGCDQQLLDRRQQQSRDSQLTSQDVVPPGPLLYETDVVIQISDYSRLPDLGYQVSV